MPDHLHLVWMGIRHESDQLNAMKFLRTELEPALGQNREWQHQPHDHLLREEERKRNAFAATCYYVLENPPRADLVKVSQDWPFSGAIVPGFPRLNPFHKDFWELFWKLYIAAREAEAPLA